MLRLQRKEALGENIGHGPQTIGADEVQSQRKRFELAEVPDPDFFG